MKTALRLAILSMAITSLPAIAQTSIPRCGTSNFDATRRVFTVMNPAADTVNQQCLITVYARNAAPLEARTEPASYIAEGRYEIELSGGGGGGGGGANRNRGGGGGGAGAVPSKTVRYLSPGVYKMTIGAGGSGGGANGGRSSAGAPSSLTLLSNGQLIAGFAGADVATTQLGSPRSGLGGIATTGGSSGGNGADARGTSEGAAQPGSMASNVEVSGTPGRAGRENPSANDPFDGRPVQANAGGGGGAGLGNGGRGESVAPATVAGSGNLGSGGGGGQGGSQTADSGSRGGDGFIRLSRLDRPIAPTAMNPVTTK